MKTIVVYSSKHHMNTEKVAQAIAGELKAEARKVSELKPQDLDGFDLVGFGSGINAFDVHPEMHALVDGLGDCKGRKAFLSPRAPRARSGPASSGRSSWPKGSPWSTSSSAPGSGPRA